ncbi:APC family permease [Microbacterium terrisoli]|uniref:APC family permease n=1 Tax=Microbacterium terrisoli TaxID=3242192 RepID=UPI002804D208|nr:APC family permease [Microbacterium protaetiae]
MSALNPAHSAQRPVAQERLHGTLGVAGIVFMVVAASSPLTVVGGAMPVALAIGNGAGLPAAYLLVAVILLLFSVGYSLMSRHVTNAGAFYSYITRGISKPAGLGAAFVALVSYTAIQAAVYGLFGATLSGLLASWGVADIPWWLCALVAMAIVGVLGYRNIDLSVRVLGVLMLCEVAIITIMCVGVLAQGGAEGISLTSFAPATFFSGSPGIAVMFAIASFMGFEATAIYGEEARDSKRTVPVATYVAVILIGVFYAFAAWALVLAYGPTKVVGAAQANTAGLAFAAAETYVGAWAQEVMNILLVTSLFAVLLAFHNAVARYLFSLGRESVISERFGRSHARHGSPHLGSLTQTASALVLLVVFAVAGLDPVSAVFSWMSGLATLGLIALMALTSAGVIVFFRRTRLDTRPWNTVIAPVLGLAGLLFLLVLVVWNFTTLIGGSLLLALIFEAILVLAFVLGVWLAARWRTSRPATYAQLGSFSG